MVFIDEALPLGFGLLRRGPLVPFATADVTGMTEFVAVFLSLRVSDAKALPPKMVANEPVSSRIYVRIAGSVKPRQMWNNSLR